MTPTPALMAHPGDEVSPQDMHPTPQDQTAPSGQPAVTVGTPVPGAPVSDTPEQSAKENAAKPKPRPFAGSSLFIANSMTTSTVFRGQQLYDDPTVESVFYLTPRYAINDAWQIRARVVLSYEWTNNDENARAHEPTLSDTTFSLYYRKIPSFAGIQPAVGVNLTLPTSKPSRARTLLVSPGVTGQLLKGFEHFLGGELDIIGALTYSHPLYPGAGEPRDHRQRALRVQLPRRQRLWRSAERHDERVGHPRVLVHRLGRVGEVEPCLRVPRLERLGVSPDGRGSTPVDGTPITETSGFDRTNLRQTHYLSVWLDYNLTPWITGEVGYWNSVSGIGPDGQQSNILFDRYQDNRVYLGASFQLDNLVKALQGGEEGAGGVVRAQIRSLPSMWRRTSGNPTGRA